jgi:hypothetical protein
MTVLGTILAATMISFCTAADAPNVGLLVTFDSGGERYSATVTRPDAVAYVLEYVAGRAPVVIPRRVLCDDEKSAERRGESAPECREGVRIVQVRDCRSGAGCVPVRGLYAGRSPF